MSFSAPNRKYELFDESLKRRQFSKRMQHWIIELIRRSIDCVGWFVIYLHY